MYDFSMDLRELFWTFLRLGAVSFGGPAAHMALMQREFVQRRNLLSNQEFLDLMAATHLIPGPNSTELAIHLGYKLRGKRGLFLAGFAFILPAFLMVLGASVFYVKVGQLPQLDPLLNGIRPIIISIIFIAFLNFRKSALKTNIHYGIALISLGLIFLGFNEILIIFLMGLFHLLWNNPLRIGAYSQDIFFYFLKVGSILFGSGYVLFAFLKENLVDDKKWLTLSQLMDAITIGQMTPGPVFTSATFIGYLLNGHTGAFLATIGIFLPSFFFVLITFPFIQRMRTSTLFSDFLDGINASSLGLLLKVMIDLMSFSFTGIIPVILSLASLFLLLKFKNLNSIWLILFGGFLGFIFLKP